MVRILIADDEDNIRSGYRKLLEQERFECDEASSVVEIVRKVQEIECGEAPPFDLMILDHSLGVAKGLDALKMLREYFGENCCKYSFIVATGSSDPNLNSIYIQQGSLGHIVKPITSSLPTFWAILQGALEDPRRNLHRGIAYIRGLSPSKQQEIFQKSTAHYSLVNDTNSLFETYSDYLELLADNKNVDEVKRQIYNIRSQVIVPIGSGRLSLEFYFNLLEGIQAYIYALPSLRDIIINEYQALAFAEADKALLDGRCLNPFIKSLRRALIAFDEQVVEVEIKDYCNQRLSEINEVDDISIEDNQIYDLSKFIVAIAGGRSSVRRQVIAELNEKGVERCIEIPPSSEDRFSKASIKEKTQSCDLIAMITGYMGHDLSRAITSLRLSGGYSGEVLALSCRGANGVTRDVLEKLYKMADF